MRITESQLRQIIREQLISASPEYVMKHETPMQAAQNILARNLIDGLPDQSAYISMIQDAVNAAGASDPMIANTLKMIPPQNIIASYVMNGKK